MATSTPEKPKDKGMDGKGKVQDVQGWMKEVSWRRHLPSPHSMFYTKLTSCINEKMTPE